MRNFIIFQVTFAGITKRHDSLFNRLNFFFITKSNWNVPGLDESKWHADFVEMKKGTGSLCLSCTFLWYMVCYFYAMLWDIKKIIWYGMLSYGIVWYGMVWYAVLCYDIWVNVTSFTEEFHLFCIFKLWFSGFSLYSKSRL